MAADLHDLMRPKTLSDVVGQKEAVAVVQTWLEAGAPHAVLFSGDSGTGKSTLAKIMGQSLSGRKDPSAVRVINCADFRGIDTAREMAAEVVYPPLSGKPVVYVLEEVVQLPKTTQQAMLTMLEEPPPWAYFLLTASDTSGLIKPFLTRLKRVHLNPLGRDDLREIATTACKTLKVELPDGYETAVRQADGSARKLLSQLEILLAGGIPSEEDGTAEDPTVLDLYKTLGRGRGYWDKIGAAIDKVLEKGTPEGVRKQLLAISVHGMRRKEALAFHTAGAMQWSFTDSGPSGLWLACWKIVTSGPG